MRNHFSWSIPLKMVTALRHLLHWMMQSYLVDRVCDTGTCNYYFYFYSIKVNSLSPHLHWWGAMCAGAIWDKSVKSATANDCALGWNLSFPNPCSHHTSPHLNFTILSCTNLWHALFVHCEESKFLNRCMGMLPQTPEKHDVIIKPCHQSGGGR